MDGEEGGETTRVALRPRGVPDLAARFLPHAIGARRMNTGENRGVRGLRQAPTSLGQASSGLSIKPIDGVLLADTDVLNVIRCHGSQPDCLFVRRWKGDVKEH